MDRKNISVTNGSQIQGNIIQGNPSGSVEFQANQVQGNTIHNLQLSEPQKTLAEAAREIQQLLKQLEQDNPQASESEKLDFVSDETTPKFKRRVVGALQAAGEAAIDEFFDNPYISIGKAIIKGWLKPE